MWGWKYEGDVGLLIVNIIWCNDCDEPLGEFHYEDYLPKIITLCEGCEKRRRENEPLEKFIK